MNELQQVTNWSALGQWCWVRMLWLKKQWKIDLPCGEEVPGTVLEHSIDGSVGILLHQPSGLFEIADSHRRWVLARLQFGSGLLQPRNVSWLGIPSLCEPRRALEFLLLDEWHHAGRDFWPATGHVHLSPTQDS